MSQQALADKFGISQQSVYQYENDIVEPDITLLRKFADFFNVSVDYIIGQTDIPWSLKNTDDLELLQALRHIDDEEYKNAVRTILFKGPKSQ